MNDEIGMRRGDLVDAMNRQSVALEKSARSMEKTADKAEVVALQTVADSRAAAIDVANHVLFWEAVVVFGAIVLWHGGKWLTPRK